MIASKYRALRFEGKVAVITASTKGIGLSIAQRLGHEGAKVVISSRKEENVQDGIKHLIATGLKKHNVYGVQCHVANGSDRQRLLHSVLKQFGKVDILINNAGMNPHFGDILDVSESVWDKLFDVNVKSSFLMTKLFVPEIEKTGGGSIIFNSSIGAYFSPEGIAAYSVTKTALLGLTKALAKSLGPKNIRVNAIAPGVIKTELSKALWEGNDEKKIARSLGASLERLGHSDECAGAVAFLCSDDASYMTGEVLVIAGGAQSRL